MENELTAKNQDNIVQYDSPSMLGLLTGVPNNAKITENEIVPPTFPPYKLNKFIDESGQYAFYRINKLSFDKDFPKREAFENVIECMGESSKTFCNFVYILSGDEKEISLHIGAVKNTDNGDKAIAIGRSVKESMEGNFNGSEIVGQKNTENKQLSNDEAKQFIFNLDNYKQISAGIITGIPSINENDKGDDADFQGIDRLINSMLGKKWRIVIVCNRATQEEIARYREEVYRIYDEVFSFQKYTRQFSINVGKSDTKGKNSSENRGKNLTMNENDSKGTSSNRNSDSGKYGRGENYQHSTGKAEGISISFTHGENSSQTDNVGFSQTISVDTARKKAQEIIKYIDDELLKRIRLGSSKGLFKTSLYYMAEDGNVAKSLKYGILSLFQGNNSSFSPLVARDFDDEKFDKDLMKTILCTFQNQSIKIANEYADELTLFGQPVSEDAIGLSTYLTGREISLLAGLPQKEVPGIVLKESTGFAVNTKLVEEKNKIELGKIMQKGRKLEVPFILNKESLSKHTFIAGTTGSGKTTTCHRLLIEADSPFLVIEPAKTEYRVLLDDKFKEMFDGVMVFSLGNENCAPFRLNPFELIEGENITSHIDMVKAAFVSAFPMEASMPQILEEAIYKCYEDKGWNIDTNQNDYYGDTAFAPNNYNAFPILSDLLLKMQDVVEKKNFGTELKNNYIGSLVSRLSNLTIGSKGALLNCPHSVNFEYIATHKVILELEELKSPEDKSLVMGFVLSKLSATVKKLHKKDLNYKHLTLVEEAHRLLSKVDYGDSGSKKSAVETFSDLLAEVRKYGEGLIVVDQIPNKLASEVLKNTNTKIIHKIFAKDDKDAVGDTMLMDDKQKQYLSSLGTGEAIIFTENTESPVHVKIERKTDTNANEIADDFVKEKYETLKANKELFGNCWYENAMKKTVKSFNVFANAIANDNYDEELRAKLKGAVDSLAKDFSVKDKNLVWQELVDNFRQTIGNFTASTNKEKTEILMKFFTGDFYKEESFTKDNFDGEVKQILKPAVNIIA